MPPRFAIARWLQFACVLGALLTHERAHADGALPDSLGVLLPLDRPKQIMIGTNFGLLLSDDAGATWHLTCEEAIGFGAALYQVGPPPQDRLFTVTVDGVSVSSDTGCGWEALRALDRPTDVFPDPSDSDHVMAIARAAAPDGSAPPAAVYESNDGGITYGDPLFVAPVNAYVTGVEIARSNPRTIYVSMTQFDANKNHPYMVRSTDAGAHWKQIELEPSIGMLLPRILAVDPEDDKRVYLRLGSTGMDQFGVYDDDAGAVSVTFALEDSMSAFLRRADRTLILAGRSGSAFVSKDAGMSFVALKNPPHLRGLGERDGVLYASTDNVMDGYAVAMSKDDAKSWQPLLRFEDIAGVRECGDLAQVCALPWTTLQATLAMPADPEAGFDAGGAPSSDAGVKKPKRKASDDGCSVGAGMPRGARAGWLAWSALFGALLSVWRSRSRPGSDRTGK